MHRVADTPGSGSYDWKQPFRPSGVAIRVADHRLLTRVVLIGLDAGWVALLVIGLISGDNHWPSYVNLGIYIWFTIHLGWIMPRSVDTWRRRQQDDPRPN